MPAPKGNKYALGCTTNGRPPHFKSEDELRNTIIEYFEYCNTEKEKATITGLTLYLGFESRSSLDDYCNRKEVFSYIIKRAKLGVENSYELNGETIDIFALKNMGWHDRRDVDLKDDRRTLDNEQREKRIEEIKKKLKIEDE